jgi:transcriptional regulator with XRE-family HTH domain
MSVKMVRFEDLKAELLSDPEVRAEYEALEPAYQVARLRILRGLTQAELADMVGTKQPSIARLESGTKEPTMAFLRKVADALGYRLEVNLVPLEESRAQRKTGT